MIDGFRPHTPREALLAIRYMVSRITEPDWNAVQTICAEGLDERTSAGFELTDQLADRLAQAHKLLREVRETEMASMGGEIDAALALPPHLEAMVERRIGPG